MFPKLLGVFQCISLDLVVCLIFHLMPCEKFLPVDSQSPLDKIHPVLLYVFLLTLPKALIK